MTCNIFVFENWKFIGFILLVIMHQMKGLCYCLAKIIKIMYIPVDLFHPT